jgi:hypothetical protein
LYIENPHFKSPHIKDSKIIDLNIINIPKSLEYLILYFDYDVSISPGLLENIKSIPNVYIYYDSKLKDSIFEEFRKYPNIKVGNKTDIIPKEMQFNEIVPPFNKRWILNGDVNIQ